MKKLLIFAFVALLFSCSSAPKRLMYVSEISDVAYSHLDSANKSIVEENYARACTHLSKAYKLALSVDNTELLCKVALSSLDFKIACPMINEIIIASGMESSSSFLFDSNEEILSFAKKLALRSSEPALYSSLCSVYEVRVLMDEEKSKNGGQLSSKSLQKYAVMLEAAKKNISKEPYYLACLHRTLGDVFLSGKDFELSYKNFETAAEIHTKNRYLVDIGLDWYCAARALSLWGKKSEAVKALEKALYYDKAAENNRGIASDYLAYSKILLKGEPTESEMLLSAELSLWSKKILAAGE